MNEDVRELDLIRTQLRAGIERDLQSRSRRSRVTHRWSFRIAIPTLAALAAATAAIVVTLVVSAASPSSAAAAARRALAATAAAPSGTMTTTVVHAGTTQTAEAARWNGSDIAYSPGDILPIQQLLLIGAGMYVQTSDGAWWHYANASAVGSKPLGGMAQLAQDTIAGVTPQQILALATNVENKTQSDGTTVYTGTIPQSSLNPATVTGNDAITSMILGAQKRTDLMSGGGGGAPGSQPSDLQLQMNVGGDGLVKQVNVTFQQLGTGSAAANGVYTWSVTYSQLGTTPPITPPASSTDVSAGTLPPGILPPGTPTQNRPTQNKPTPAITHSDRLDYLNAAACMRSHGIPDFPNPTFGNNTVTFHTPPNINPNSSQAKRAVAICVKLIPPGLPYSNRSTR